MLLAKPNDTGLDSRLAHKKGDDEDETLSRKGRWSVDNRDGLYLDQKGRIRERRHTHPGRGRCSVTGKELPECAPDCFRLVRLVRDNVDPQRHHIFQSTAARLNDVAQIEESLPRLGSQVRSTDQ